MSDESQELPNEVWSGSFRILGVDVKCSVLDDGRRIVDAESFERLMASMNAPDNGAELGELAEFSAWRLGLCGSGS